MKTNRIGALTGEAAQAPSVPTRKVFLWNSRNVKTADEENFQTTNKTNISSLFFLRKQNNLSQKSTQISSKNLFEFVVMFTKKVLLTNKTETSKVGAISKAQKAQSF